MFADSMTSAICLHNYQYSLTSVSVMRRWKNAASVICEGFDDNSVILAPGAVMTGNHEMYKGFFTPFKNARLKRLKRMIFRHAFRPRIG